MSASIGQTSPGFLPFGVTGITPQGFDFGQLVGQIATAAGQVLPGLILGALSAHPTLGPQLRAQAAAAGVTPQSLINVGFQSPFGAGGISLFGAAPPAVTPQGFDPGQLARQLLDQVGQEIIRQLVPALPGLILGALSAHPTVGPQLRAQAATPGVAPQSLFNFGIQTPVGGGGISMFGATPQAVTPQDFDPGQLAQQVLGQILPVLITGLLSASPNLAVRQNMPNSSVMH